MRRHHNESSVTTASRRIPVSSSPQGAQFIDGPTSCSSVNTGASSDSVMIETPSPCGTPPRKRWEGAFNSFLRGKSVQQSPTLSTSPSSSVNSSIQIAEDLSTGTGASASSSSGIGSTRATKKKSSFKLIPGSRRLVSRKGSSKSNNSSIIPSVFSKGGSNGHPGLFSRSHNSMDCLDIPLRKGAERSASPSRLNLNRREQSSSSSTTMHPPVASVAPEHSSERPLHKVGLQGEQERLDHHTTATASTAPSSATSALNDQLRDSSISPTSYIHPHPPNPPITRTFSADWRINPIVNEGVDLALRTLSAPSLIQLHSRRSHSRTFMYSSSSNSSTPVKQHQPQEELDLRMIPQIPSLRAMSNTNRSSSLDFQDVGLNLDDSENFADYGNHHRQDQSRSELFLGSNYSDRNSTYSNNSNTTTIITDCGIPEPPETLDEIFGSSGGLITVHSSSSHLFSKMENQIAASPETKKAFTKIHNSSEYGQDISPFLGGNKASNVDLASAHRSCVVTQQSMLLRSMNSNLNINGALRTQFGSIPHISNMESVDQFVMKESHNSPLSFLSQSLPFDTFSNNGFADEGLRLLKPIQSADSWAQGRRYLIAPAALAACPLSTIKNLAELTSQSAVEAAKSTDPPKASRVIELGDAFMTYVGDKYHLTCGKWSACRLVLRQNYLLEYDLSAPLNSLPRGIAHLQHAVAHSQRDFDDAIELRFYASPCAKADQRVLLIRVKNKEERDHWITCLNQAARLKIGDIWEYNEAQPLGTGRYASIFSARRKMPHLRHNGEERRCDEERIQNENNCALKIIDKSEFWKLVVKGRERCDTIVRELSVQSTLTAKFGANQSFLQIRGFFETSEKVVIELELLDGKDLFEYMSSKGVLEEDEAGLIIRDVLESLNSMSQAGIAHRDIKPANILMTRCDESKYGTSVKVADFGMSTLVGVDGFVRGRCGSPGYVAPEILKAEAGEGYRNQVDMFSAGVTLYLMLCGYEPFYGETEKELIYANKKGKVDFPKNEWRKISSKAKDLVSRMLEADPEKRISAKEAVDHPWIVGLSQRKNRCHPESNDNTRRNPELEGGVCAIM